MKKLILSSMFLPLLLSAANIFMAGDSTMCRYSAKRAPRTGWGMEMQQFCVPKVRVLNYAVSGTSSKSFRIPKDPQNAKRKYWDRMISRVKAGDFVIIQFGHNDAASGEKNLYRHAAADTDFQTNLKEFIKEVRAKKATPILCTPTVVLRVTKKGAIVNTKMLNKYVAAVKKVAAETKCDMVDLNGKALEELNKKGAKESEKFYMFLEPGKYENFPKGVKDRIHLRKEGANFYAKLFVEAAKEQKLPVSKLFK